MLNLIQESLISIWCLGACGSEISLTTQAVCKKVANHLNGWFYRHHQINWWKMYEDSVVNLSTQAILVAGSLTLPVSRFEVYTCCFWLLNFDVLLFLCRSHLLTMFIQSSFCVVIITTKNVNPAWINVFNILI